jgi:hypothetical protein
MRAVADHITFCAKHGILEGYGIPRAISGRPTSDIRPIHHSPLGSRNVPKHSTEELSSPINSKLCAGPIQFQLGNKFAFLLENCFSLEPIF